MKSFSIGFRDFTRRVFPTLYIIDKKGSVKKKITKHNNGYYNVKLEATHKMVTCLDEHKDKIIITDFLKEDPYPNEILIENGTDDKYCSNIKKYNNINGKPQSNQTSSSGNSNPTEHDLGELEDPYQLDLGGVKPPYSNTNQTQTSVSTNSSTKKRKKMKFQIIDGTTRQPLMGAEVYNTATKTGAVTDANGIVSIMAAPDDIIQIRYMGYQPIDIPAKNIDTVILMTQATEELDAVTITVSKKSKKWMWIIGGLIVFKFLSGGKKGMNMPEDNEDDIPVIEI